MAVEVTVTESAKGKAAVVGQDQIFGVTSGIGASSGTISIGGPTSGQFDYNATQGTVGGALGCGYSGAASLDAGDVILTYPKESAGVSTPFTLTGDTTDTQSAGLYVSQVGVAPEAAVNEVHNLAFSTVPAGGTWTISYDGSPTPGLAYNADNDTIRDALEDNIFGDGQIAVSGSYATGIDITFQGEYAATDMDYLLVVDDSALTEGGGGGGTAKVPIALFVGRAA